MSITKKEVSEKIFLSTKKTLTIPEIPVFAEEVIGGLCEEAGKLNLVVNGSCEFIYFGCTGDLEESFELMIGIPIEERKNDSELFEYYDSSAYSCICKDYLGDVKDIGDAWQSFCDEAAEKGFTFSPDDQAREIYKKMDKVESSDNIIEMQIIT